MCFDATTSLVSFVSGIVLSVIVMSYGIAMKQQALAILAGGWVWVIFMQWWEYMIWSNRSREMAMRMAYVFNIMQIPLLYFLFILWSPVSFLYKALATLVIFVYVCIMSYPNTSTDVRVSNHLNYSWWSNQTRVVMYFLGLAAIFCLLVRPLAWSLCCVVTLFVLLGLSMAIYGRQGVPSLWCFFAVFFPVLAWLYAILLKNE